MTDAILGQLIVASTAVISGALGLAGGLWLEHSHARREVEARSEARKDIRDDLQRRTLLELQEAITQFTHVVGSAYRRDEVEFMNSGKWVRSLFGPVLSEDFTSAQIALTNLRERTQDDELRRLVNRFFNLGVLACREHRHESMTQRIDDWMEAQATMADRLGTVLRSYL